MRAALLAAQTSGDKNILDIARTYGVGKDALYRRLKNRVAIDAVVGPKPHLTDEEDQILVRFIKLMAKGGFGFCPQTLKEFVETFMRRKGFDTTPSSAWVSRFLLKHDDLSKRVAKNMSIQRLESMNRENLNDFYDLLTPLISDNIPGEVVFNCDEVGFCLSPREGTLIAPRGIKTLFQTVPFDGHKYITVHVCGNAKGVLLPPMIIFKAKKFNKNWQKLWDGAVIKNTESGWMNKEVFAYWLENVFYPEASKSRPEGYTGPLYLVFDGHLSHTNSDVIEVASRLNIVLIKLPSHSTHILQPLDVSFFGPLKTHWFSILNEWNREYNQTVCNEHFPALLKRTFERIKSTWLVNGFAATGIFPVNQNAIPDSRIMAAKPWNSHGWRWYDESESVVLKLKEIQPLQSTSVMETVCLDHIINVLDPLPVPQRISTTTLTRVPTQEERLKRGSRLGAVLTPQASTSSSQTLAFQNLNIESQGTPPISMSYKEQCLVCNTNVANARWICCSNPTCGQWLHCLCVPEVEYKSDDELANYIWFCAICEKYRFKEIEAFYRAKHNIADQN